MTIAINVLTSDSIDLRWSALYNLFANSTPEDGGTTTQFSALVTGHFDGNDADIRFVFEGTGFSFTGSFPNIELTGGTINNITMQTEAGITLATFTGFNINGANFAAALDAYTAGGPGSPDPSALDAIFKALDYSATGSEGTNFLEGGDLGDIINGEGGDDVLTGGPGGDTFNGGTGFDRVSYITSATALTVDLLTPANNTGDASGDSYVAIEGLEGSIYDDVLRGDSLNNFFIGGPGADVMDGRGGGDLAMYSTASSGLTVSLANSALNTGDAAGDTYISIENLAGSHFDDLLYGDSGNNFLRGQLGADVLDGGAGFDTADYFGFLGSTLGVTVDLGTPTNNTGEAAGDSYISIENIRGSKFGDVLRGNEFNNALDGQAGADILDGGAGFDFAWYNTNSTGTGVLASLANPTINTGDAAGDVYISIEGLIGSFMADTLIGDAGENFLRGQGGADVLDGGAGDDYADYFTSTFGLTVDLANPLNNTGEAAGDTYISIEKIRGGTGNDILRGNEFNNTLRGGIGADTLDGGSGSDFASYSDSNIGLTASLANPGDNTGEAAGDVYISIESLRGGNFDDALIGNGSDNFLQGGQGGDLLDGGAGNDYADYFHANAGLTVDLANSLNNTGEAAGDTYISIERVRGSAFDDVLRGNQFGNTLRGGLGADTLDGGNGSDFASYSDSDTAVTASLANSGDNTGEAAGDIYISIESLRGSNFADTLIGNSGNNFLQGGPDGDALVGGSGFDFADYINASSAVTVDLSNPANNTGEATGDTFVSIEGIRGSAFDDTLRGDDVLNGGNAVNQLIGGLGADILDGAGGFDYADYRNSAVGLTVSLTDPGLNTGEAAGDVFISIEGLIGSDHNDALTGDGADNFIAGGLGADAIDGGDGLDYAAYFRSSSGVTVSLADPGQNTGEAVGDTYTAVEGIRGSDFDDTLIGDTGDNSLAGGSGGDALDGGAGNDTAYYQLWSAQVGLVANLSNAAMNTGEAAGDSYISIENLWGTRFNDTLIGDGNDNVLTGIDGNDILVGGGGADTLDGGGGNLDRASYSTAASGLVVDLLNTGNSTGDAAGDIYFGIEGLEGSNFDDDLGGNNNGNFLIGGQGADVLDGRGGGDFASYATASSGLTASLANPASNTGDAAGDTYISIESLAGSSFDDVLIGDSGNNALQGRFGADSLQGGGGFDLADYNNASSGITVDLSNPFNNTGEAVGDTFIAIEGIRGSAFDDVLIGNNVVNGGASLNILRGGRGADTLIGNGGTDYADYVESPFGITVSLANPELNTGEAAGDIFIGIVGLYGGNFDDTLIGDANSNRLSGGGGWDQLIGGDGFDLAHYNRATTGVTASLADAAANTGEAFGDTYDSIEGLIGSNFSDILIGDGGNNVLQGASGGDVLDGGAGNDTADYMLWTAQAGVTASLSNSGMNTGDAAGDTYISIENLRGTIFNDTLAGDAGNNTLDGNGGVDTVVFTGNRTDYEVVQNPDGSIAISDTRSGSPDGTDTAINAEQFQFADATYTAAELFNDNQAPTDITLDNITIDEDATPGTLVGTLGATDPDAGDTLTFSIIDDAGGRFEIANGNEIVVASGAPLNYEANATHSLTVRVTDASGLFYDETFNIAVNNVNEEPTSLTLSGDSVQENALAGTLVGTLHAADPDAGDVLTFALVDDAGGLFELVGNELRVAAGAELDFETSSTHTVAVEVTDSEGLSRLETFTVTVTNTNEAPDSLVISGLEVEENAAPGTVVATLSATDPDTGDTLSFSLTDDAGGRFVVVGNEVRVAPGADIDFELASSHEITVEVRDSTGFNRAETVAISVLNVDEAPTDIILSGGEIDEDAVPGTVVATLEAVDPDGPDNLTFTLTDDAAGTFEIVGNEIRLAAVLDYEAQSSYVITVEVSDASGLTRTESFTINVLNANEGPTDITVSGGTVQENAAAGTLVATLAAVDPDVGETFTFEIIDDPSGFFEIAGNQIRVADGAAIDYETATAHTVSLRVTDSTGAFYEEDLTIAVQNVAPIIIGTNSANTLVGTSEEDQIFGRGGNDTISGGLGNDQLFGEAGNDTLEGGEGVDTLAGGLNNDTYVLNAADGDILIENLAEGTDTVRLGADFDGLSFTLGANFENLVITGLNDIAGNGNTLDNVLTGNSGNNTLDGGAGIDTMTGGGGDDVFYVDVSGDRVIEAAGGGIDEIRTGLATFSLAALGNVEDLRYTGSGAFTGTGNSASNTLRGGSNDDSLDGAGGADTLVGGVGNDTYFVNHAGDVVVELAGQGTDTVRSSLNFTLGSEIENLILTGTSGLTGTGNSLANTLTGNTGANTLDGAGGNDTLAGGAGNDTYVVSEAGDVIVELAGQGTDTVRSLLADFGLETFANVENLTFIGAGNFTGRGNDLGNIISGGSGNDVLQGGAGNDTLQGNGGEDSLVGGLGADTMRGGTGDDSYVFDDALDRAIENLGEGTDTVTSSVNITLGANVENLVLTGAATDGTGNGLANVITGTSLTNTLNGQAGNDVLIGGGGLDTLLGGSGDDALVFTASAFTRADGGTNQDTFVFGGDFDLDLTGIGNSVLTGLEAFDISGGAGINNTLRLGIDDVRDLSSSANAALASSGFAGPLSTNSIVVYGDAGDIVSLAPGTGTFAGGSWQTVGVATIGGDTFDVLNYVRGSTLYGSIAVDSDMFIT